MKRQSFITAAIAAIAISFLAAIVFYGHGLAPNAYLDERLRPGELVSIRRDLYRTQLVYVERAAASGHWLSALRGMRSIAFCRIQGVSRPSEGYVIIQTGYPWASNSSWVYDLKLTTNGWTY